MTLPTMIEAGGGTRARVQNAIATASAATGVDFSYLFHQAKIESGFNPEAKAATSSATGLYQFIEQSWLGVVRKHGAEHGLGWAADAIGEGSDGKLQVSDPQARQAILALRQDPEVSATMAAEFASDNKAVLERRLGRDVESVDLYLAHFLGPAGATRFLKGMDANPAASAAAVLPAAARANPSIFYDKAGAPRSFGEIRARFAAKLGGEVPAETIVNPNYVPETGLPGTTLAALDTRELNLAQLRLSQGAAGTSLISPNPQNARLAYLLLANLGA